MPGDGKTEQNQSHHPHDKGYRQLLAKKKTFLELLQTFVGEGWVWEIEEDDLMLVDKSYVLQDFSDKEADIVYRLRLQDTDVIFYVLLELQSTVDHTMPFRLLQYMVEVWRDAYNNTPEKERKRKGFRLPAIVPAVLYNGERGWTARRSFSEYQHGQERLSGHLLDFKYILFDVNRYGEEDLQRSANVISSVFYLDQTADPRELVKRIRELADVLKGMTPEQFRQVTVWLRNAVKSRLPETLREEMDLVLEETEPWEVEKMITNIERTLGQMQRQAKTEGKVEVARAALKKGFSVDDVAEITGLSRETVMELKRALEN